LIPHARDAQAQPIELIECWRDDSEIGIRHRLVFICDAEDCFKQDRNFFTNLLEA